MVKIAVIGCGAIAQRHIPAVMASPECELSLLVDSNPETLERLKKKTGDIPSASDFEAHASEYDAAVVALPHHLHEPVTVKLLEMGKHVLIEKPLAVSSQECDRINQAARDSTATLSVGLMRRHLHSVRTVKQIIEHNVLGDLVSFNFEEGNVYNWPVQSASFFSKQTAGGGVLLDTGAHTIDLLVHWLGDEREIRYQDDSFGGVEADCLIELEMQNGATGTVELSRTRDLRNTAIIRGTVGTVEVDLRANTMALQLFDGDVGVAGLALPQGSSTPEEQGFGDLFFPQIEHWVQVIRGEASPMTSGEDAARSIRIIERCYSHRSDLVFPWEANVPSEETTNV